MRIKLDWFSKVIKKNKKILFVVLLTPFSSFAPFIFFWGGWGKGVGVVKKREQRRNNLETKKKCIYIYIFHCTTRFSL